MSSVQKGRSDFSLCLPISKGSIFQVFLPDGLFLIPCSGRFGSESGNLRDGSLLEPNRGFFSRVSPFQFLQYLTLLLEIIPGQRSLLCARFEDALDFYPFYTVGRMLSLFVRSQAHELYGILYVRLAVSAAEPATATSWWILMGDSAAGMRWVQRKFQFLQRLSSCYLYLLLFWVFPPFQFQLFFYYSFRNRKGSKKKKADAVSTIVVQRKIYCQLMPLNLIPQVASAELKVLFLDSCKSWWLEECHCERLLVLTAHLNNTIVFLSGSFLIRLLLSFVFYFISCSNGASKLSYRFL